MKSVLRRAINHRPVCFARRSKQRQIRIAAVLVVVCLLLTSLPANSRTTRGFARQVNTPGFGQPSFASRVYRGVTTKLASLGSWMTSYLKSESRPASDSTYQPVVAYFNSPPPFIDAPTNLNVTGVQASRISLSWIGPAAGGVDHYQIERSTNISGSFTFLTNVSGAVTFYNDDTVSNQHSYLYRVRSVASGGAVSAPSNLAMGTAIAFEFANLQGQEIRKQHFYDIRTAVNAVRALANLSPASWAPRDNLTGLEVQATDVQQMRTALDAALAALTIPVIAYDDATLSTGANGTLIRAVHLEQLQTRSTRGSSNLSGSFESTSSTARLDPMNQTGGGGENPLSRNFNWSLPLLSLPGRAGMDLNLTLSYNSLVWTKIGSNSISFDEDNGFPGPGFRLGFPVIQPLYLNSETGKNAFLLIGSDGSHTELRQVGSLALYESADSSHLLLDSTAMILRTTDGTQLSYELKGAEYVCTQIKDRNGNYISATYTTAGRINTITDTLARVITFEYDIDGYLTAIKQTWKQGSPSPVTHYWARFEHANTSINYNFGSVTVFGLADNSTLKMLSKVKLADDSYFDFVYTSWGQVSQVINRAADNTPLNYRLYNLPTADTEHGDCPRFTTRKDWAKYWNGDTDGTMATNEEVATATFIIPVEGPWTMPDNSQPNGMRAEVTSADGTLNKIFYIGTKGTSSGWQRGLPAVVETHSGGTWQRRTITTWTQDDLLASYPVNPRITETNIYDPSGNRARTTITYQQFDLSNNTSCHLPQDVYEYAADASTILRSTRTSYNMSPTYKNLRILGLASEKSLYEGDVNDNGALMSKLAFFYDESGSILGNDTPVQHDNTYNSNFVDRGNLSSVKRYDVNEANNDALAITTVRAKYNTGGAVVSTKDALGHETTISYADSFSDGTPRNTLAYPTSMTDPDTFISTAKYNFDFGAVTSRRTPKPNETINKPENERPEQVFTYDSLGRLEQITNSVNAASTRFVYATSNNRVDSYTKVEASLAEGHSWEIADGFGRVVGSAKDHTATSFSGQKFVYDMMGRVFKTSNPTETSASGHPSGWSAVGDDATVGWLYIEQTYDWKGRPLVTTNQDGTTKTASYSGCGCAGGEVVTLTDEGTIDPFDLVTPRKRQQKIYSDVLGRTVKTEILNWEGGAVSAATVNTYNARDQIAMIRQFSGAAPSDPADLSCPSGTCQKSEMTFDGHGRLKTSHVPERQVDSNNPASTDHKTWDYNTDDTIQKITDPRGAVSTFSYNGRHALTNITYTLLQDVPTTGSSGVVSAATVSYQYDAAGNRKVMNDAMGSVTYTYDLLSRLTSETRYFSNLSGSSTGGNYTLGYEYNLTNQMTKLTDPNNLQINYGYDHIGRLSGVTGVGFSVSTFLSNIQYRAWGAPKSVAHKDNRTAETTYDARLRVATYKLLPATPDDGVKLHNQYEYFPDGRLKKLTDLDDHDPSIVGVTDSARWFSRVYTYDNRGRILKAKGWNPNGYEFDFPFEQYYSYDSYNHMTSRFGSYYYQPDFTDSGTYVNNRQQGWDYGADGQETHSTGPGMFRDLSYNAAGKMIQVKETQTANNQFSTYVASYDGDGELAMEFLQEDPTNTNSYKVRSSILGEVLTRLDNAGNKTGTTVHFDKRVTTARIDSSAEGSVGFPVYEDPLHQSIAGDKKAVYDPLGNHIPWRPWPGGPPPNFYPRSSSQVGSLGSSFGSAQERGCTLAELPISCQMAAHLTGFGANNTTGSGPTAITFPGDPFGPPDPIDWNPDFLDWVWRTGRRLTDENFLSLGSDWFSQNLRTIDPCTTARAEMDSSGQGFYTYENSGWLKYAQGHVISAFENFASGWNQNHPDNPIGVGDLGAWDGVGNFRRHPSSGHAGGLLMDLRPMRNDNVRGPTNFNAATYSYNLTNELVQGLAALPDVVRIRFNDTNVQNNKIVRDTDHFDRRGNRLAGVHDNHLHVTFRAGTPCPTTLR